MSDFKALATKFVHKTFAQFAKPLSIFTAGGSCENGTGIDITNSFSVDQTEDFELVIVTDVAQWTKKPDVGNIDVVFNRTNLKIVKIDEDPAQAAYFIHAKTYLRKAITIQEKTLTPDGQGGFTEVWSVFASVEAEVERAEASEANESGRLNNTQDLKFVFRYTDGITSDMRILYDSRVMPIRSVINYGDRDQWLEVVAEQGAAP